MTLESSIYIIILVTLGELCFLAPELTNAWKNVRTLEGRNHAASVIEVIVFGFLVVGPYI